MVVAVSKAGGCGVLGAVGMTPDQLEEELNWIDEHIDGLPYGVDVLIPNKMADQNQKFDAEKLTSMIPQEYADFRADVLEKHGIEADELEQLNRLLLTWLKILRQMVQKLYWMLHSVTQLK